MAGEEPSVDCLGTELFETAAWWTPAQCNGGYGAFLDSQELAALDWCWYHGMVSAIAGGKVFE